VVSVQFLALAALEVVAVALVMVEVLHTQAGLEHRIKVLTAVIR
jgi:hypothetical protein